MKPINLLYIFFFFILSKIPLYAQNCDELVVGKNEQYTQAVRNYLNAGLLDSAIFTQIEARRLLDQSTCNSLKAKAAVNLLSLLYRKKDLEAYNKEKEHALYLAKHILPNTDSTQGLIYQALGNNALQDKDFTLAETYLEKALNSFSDSHAWSSYVKAAISIINLYQDIQDYNNMKQHLDEAYAVLITKSPDNIMAKYNIQQIYGAYYYRIGDYHKALDSMVASLHTNKTNLTSNRDSINLINAYNNTGLLYAEVGDVEKAEEYCLNAISLAFKIKDYNNAIFILYNLGETNRVKGDYIKAYEYYIQAKNLFTENYPINNNKDFDNISSQSQRLLININNSIAENAPYINKSLEGLQALKKNLSLHEIQPYRKEETLRILGDYYYKNEDIETAIDYYTQSLQLSAQLYNEHHPLLARLYQSLGKVYQLQKEHQKALSFFDKGLIALYNNNVKPNLTKLPSKNAITDRTLYAEILHDKAISTYKLRDLINAQILIAHAFDLITEVKNEIRSEGSKLFIQNKLMPIYELSLRFCYDFYVENQRSGEKSVFYINKAFEIMERSKAALLLETIKATQARHLSSIPEHIVIEEKRLKNEIATLDKKLFEAENNTQKDSLTSYREMLINAKDSLNRFQQNVERDYSNYYNLKNQEKILSLKEIQKKLSPKQQILEYFFGTEHIYISRITKDTAILYQMVKNHQIDNKIAMLQNSLTNYSLLLENPQAAYQLFTHNAHYTYNMLVEEVIDSTKPELIIIPDGLLNYIPFEALITEEVKSTNPYDFKTLPYLLHKYNISYNYSTSLTFYEKSEQQKYLKGKKVLAFAPSYEYTQPSDSTKLNDKTHQIRKDLKELPGTKFELDLLKAIFVGDYYYDKEATEKNFKAVLGKREYGILHLAMHGYIDNKRPEYSSLILTHTPEDSTEDNILHAYELMLMNIPSDLVVLSACETGFGRLERGESVASIGRAFMHAGTKSVLMTLWPINDQTSAILMNFFYEKLALGISKNLALGDAKKIYIEHASTLTAHPFFWASFIQMGNSEPIEIQQPLALSDYLLYATILSFLALGIYWLKHSKGKEKKHIKKKPSL